MELIKFHVYNFFEKMLKIVSYTVKNFPKYSKKDYYLGLSFDGGIINIPKNPTIDIFDLENLSTDYLKEIFNKKHIVTPHDNVSILSPIPYPKRNIICVGKNYIDHIAEVQAKDTKSQSSTAALQLPKYPVFFTKAPQTIVNPGDYIESHASITNFLDYEAELAVVIGKEGRDIPRDKAFDHVFGYTIANDVTARDIQRQHNQFFKGKTLDRTCPLGPYLVPKSEIPNPENLSIKLWLNNKLMQDSNTSKMIFDIPDIIAHLSKGFTLYPGDIILTGTPDGVGYARSPPVTLQSGDKIKIEIENLGTLENYVK